MADLWLMPPDDLHITALEIAHSLPADNIHSIVSLLGEHAARELVAFPTTNVTPPRLVHPQLSIDRSAVALQELRGSSRRGRVDA